MAAAAKFVYHVPRASHLCALGKVPLAFDVVGLCLDPASEGLVAVWGRRSKECQVKQTENLTPAWFRSPHFYSTSLRPFPLDRVAAATPGSHS